ncbi:MAG: hypothetical protein V7K41_15380 [Nostoc sp.]|uniref:hypothetical protein n=1 Tax=Nostoc sp. TaxID=1180 RepID=UPI002FF5816B
MECAKGIAPLIPMMPDSHLLLKQQQVVEQFLATNEPAVCHRRADEPQGSHS